MAQIVETDESGELHLTAEQLPGVAPHTRYVLEVQGDVVMLKPVKDGKLPFWATATTEERLQKLQEWFASHPPGPVLPDEALRRENMYD